MRKTFFTLIAILLLTSSLQNSYAALVVPASSVLIEPDPAKAKAREAIEAFKKLPSKEKKARLKEAKKEIKAFKKAKRAGKETDTDTLLLVIIALILPPLAVYLHQGETNNKFWITLLLFVLGVLGGFLFSWFLLLAAIVYALIVILGGA